MAKRLYNFAACFVCIGLMVAGPFMTGLAADKTNYSGKYLVQGRTTDSGFQLDSIIEIEVVQNEDSVEVTRVEQGRRTTNLYPLNGSEGSYRHPAGMVGKCKGKLTEKYLVLESIIAARPQPTAPPMRMHTKERWQLSADANLLTIKQDVDFPNFPSEISAAVADFTSGTKKYRRTESP